jgi:hypothetical protein
VRLLIGLDGRQPVIDDGKRAPPAKRPRRHAAGGLVTKLAKVRDPRREAAGGFLLAVPLDGKQVHGLHVAMDDPGGMGSSQRVGGYRLPHGASSAPVAAIYGDATPSPLPYLKFRG